MNYQQLLILSLIAFIVSYLATPWAKKVSQSCGMVDNPGARKIHTEAIPYGGGIAIFLGFLTAFVILGTYTPKTFGFLIGAFIIVILGIFDDLKGLNAMPKFIFQSLAALVVISAGIVIDPNLLLRGHLPGLEFLAIPLTFLWIVGITNAINLIDGLDGLAAGVSTISALTIGAVAILNGQYLVSTISFIVAFASLGFLPHNFRSRIFMGDTGSMFLGFSLATLSIMGSVKLAAAYSLFVPVMILAIPIFDTAFAIVRRVVAKKPIYIGDRKHLHHRLLDLGFSPKQTVIFIYLLSLLFGGMAILSAIVRPRYGYMIFGISLLVVLLGSLILVYFHQLKTKEGEWLLNANSKIKNSK